jgi:hypothetical protein
MARCPSSERQAAQDVTNLTFAHAARSIAACQWRPSCCQRSVYLQLSFTGNVLLHAHLFSLYSVSYCPGDIIPFSSLWLLTLCSRVLSANAGRPFHTAGLPFRLLLRPLVHQLSPQRGRHGDNEPTFLSFPTGSAHHCNAESSHSSTEPTRSRTNARRTGCTSTDDEACQEESGAHTAERQPTELRKISYSF